MQTEDSVVLMRQFEQGDDTASEKLFAKYFERLDRYADRRISGKLRQRVGADDIAQSVYRSFFEKAKQGVFEFTETGELWRMLAFLARRKIQRKAEWHGAQKRNAANEQPVLDDLEFVACSDDSGDYNQAEIDDAIEFVLNRVCANWSAVLNAAAEEVDVAEIAAVVGESETDVRRVLILRLRCAAGLTTEDVATLLDCSEVTVRRIWRNLLQFAETLSNER